MRKYILILTCFVMGCQSKNSSSTTFFTNFKEGASLTNWSCLKIDNERVCTPSSWKPSKQSKYLYYYNLNNLDKNSYFVILKYNKTISGLNDSKYLGITYDALMKDTVEKFTGYTSKKIVFNDKVVYYNEYYTKYNNKPYLTYSMVFEIDDNLYEIAIKSDSANSKRYQAMYPNILFNFQHNGKPVFSSKDEVKDIQIVDLAKLD